VGGRLLRGARTPILDARRVGVVHEHDVLRRGVAGCLDEEPSLEVAYAVAGDPPREPVDVAVVSRAALTAQVFECAVVVFDIDPAPIDDGKRSRVAASLALGRVTAEQLVVSVRAAAAGLSIAPREVERQVPKRLDERRLHVLRLLASGDTTRAISSKLCYSERTIKGLIRDVEYELSATNRAQAVAEAIRQGLI
jgi:DNA-binding CsgD family transcriptional regulator